MGKVKGMDCSNEITGRSTLDLLNQDLAKKVRTAYDRKDLTRTAQRCTEERAEESQKVQ